MPAPGRAEQAVLCRSATPQCRRPGKPACRSMMAGETMAMTDVKAIFADTPTASGRTGTVPEPKGKTTNTTWQASQSKSLIMPGQSVPVPPRGTP